MDSEHNILITLPSDNLLERLIDLLQKHGETDNDGVIGISMLVVAAIYEKYKNGELYTEVVPFQRIHFRIWNKSVQKC